MRVVVACLLLAATFAGCTGGDADFVPAMDLRASALSIAKGTFPEPELVAALALAVDQVLLGDRILASEEQENEWFGNFLKKGDPDVSDGRYQAWLFIFRDAAGSPDPLGVVATPGGRSLRAFDTTVSSGAAVFTQFTPNPNDDLADFLGAGIGEVRIDSDEAARIARAENATYADFAARRGVLGWSILQQRADVPGSDPYWLLGLEQEEDQARALVIVNARTGEVNNFSLVAPSHDPRSWPRALFTGPVRLGERSGTQGFEISAPDHAWMGLRHHYRGDPPHWPLRMTIMGPDGSEVSWSPAESGAGASFFIDAPSAGRWTATLEISAQASPVPPPSKTEQEYLVWWCAGHGERPEDPEEVPQCTKGISAGDGEGARGAPF